MKQQKGCNIKERSLNYFLLFLVSYSPKYKQPYTVIIYDNIYCGTVYILRMKIRHKDLLIHLCKVTFIPITDFIHRLSGPQVAFKDGAVSVFICHFTTEWKAVALSPFCN